PLRQAGLRLPRHRHRRSDTPLAPPVIRRTGPRTEALHLSPGQRLIVDLSGVNFCDSTGITALLAARQHVQAAGATLILEAVPTHLIRIFTLTGLDQVFTCHPGDPA
ncbi:STAS domain-containing protein, partial [Streptomyces sp. NPDC085659]|uniref:STAS domain-containing protein n=1 Tax=Streptomyces sp. NPDC085659 TaxID=3155177 RepID=UPI00344D1D63